MPDQPNPSEEVGREVIEAIAAMRWNEGNRPNTDSPSWDELDEMGAMRAQCCDEVQAALKELLPFVAPAIRAATVEEFIEALKAIDRRDADDLVASGGRGWTIERQMEARISLARAALNSDSEGESDA